MEAIIKSMTVLEKEQPDIINASRRKRIAKGSGTSVQEVNRLLKQFDEIEKNDEANDKHVQKERKKDLSYLLCNRLYMIKPLLRKNTLQTLLSLLIYYLVEIFSEVLVKWQ